MRRTFGRILAARATARRRRLDWIELALSKPGADRHPALRVRALFILAWSLWPVGRGAEHRAVWAEARATAEAVGDPALLSIVLSASAVQEGWDGRLDVAAQLAHKALSCARTTGDQWIIAMAAWAEALTPGSARELRERVEQASTLLKAAGNAYHAADVYHVAADRALAHGSFGDALEFGRRARCRFCTKSAVPAPQCSCAAPWAWPPC